MEEMTTFGFGFEKALDIIKKGGVVSRKQFRDTCFVSAQYPDANSKMTKPYLVMHKKVQYEEILGINEIRKEYDIFPLDLSCESIFAEDWYQCHFTSPQA